ncbi:NAD(P)H-binding protein [Nocardia sp. NPDC057663]|uniref:NAD(P)H-binding protein n=1 Tax=Nocardia sp. NPDC057663 TaxID=3346201 RepID=UPI00366D7F19
MILVTGVGGQLGKLIFDGLVTVGAEVTAGSRAPESLSIPARRVDFDDPSSLVGGFDGVRTLVLVSAGFGEDDVVMARHRAAIEAAGRSGVAQVIYTSLLGGGDHLSLATAHRYTEHLLSTAQFGYTILRNGLYAELFALEVIRAATQGVVASAWGEGRVRPVARADLAAAAVIVADEVERAARWGIPSRHMNRSYDLGGTEPVGADEIAMMVAGATGREIERRDVSLAEVRAEMTKLGLPAYQVGHVLSIVSGIRAGHLDNDTSDLADLIGRAPVSVERALLGAAGVAV